MTAQLYKSNGNQSLFDKQNAQEKLIVMGNPLEKLTKEIDFEMFRALLESKLINTTKKTNAGAKPYDYVMMFKIMILQRYYGLGDTQVEYQIYDRLSFKIFLGLASGDRIPDEKTIWAFRENLTKLGLVDELFALFTNYLESKQLIINEGKIVDASFVIAPRQRNTRDENKSIKEGNGENLWVEKPNKKRHKDVHARWTVKNKEKFYGFKNHTKIDAKSKFIDNYTVTNASVHDSQELNKLLTIKDANQNLYADSAYSGLPLKQVITSNNIKNMVHEKGYRKTPLTEMQKENNKEKSKIRARVEHIFGFMEQSMNGLVVKSVGILRATGIIGTGILSGENY